MSSGAVEPQLEKISMPVGPQIIGRLIDRHASALTLYARQICQEPEDAVQQAFIKLAAQARPPEAPVAWLYRVVRNEALTAVRASRRRRHREVEVGGRKEKWFLPATDDQIDGRAAMVALQSLSPRQREIVTAHIWGGLTFVEIGELLSISASGAHRRYQSALASLRKKVGVSCQKND